MTQDIKKRWIIPAILSGICWGLFYFIPKATVESIDPLSGLVYQVAGNLLVGLIVLALIKFKLERNRKGALTGLLVGILNMAGVLGLLYAIQHGKISIIAIYIGVLVPIIPIILAYLILKERLTIRSGFGIAFALLAIALFS